MNIDGTFPVCLLMQHKNADPTLPSFFLGGTWVMQSEDLLSKAKLKFISYLVKWRRSGLSQITEIAMLQKQLQTTFVVIAIGDEEYDDDFHIKV